MVSFALDKTVPISWRAVFKTPGAEEAGAEEVGAAEVGAEESSAAVSPAVPGVVGYAPGTGLVAGGVDKSDDSVRGLTGIVATG